MAVMLSGVLMLRHLHEVSAADAMEGAISRVIALGANVTYDLKEKRGDPTAVGTSQVADAVIAQLKAGASTTPRSQSLRRDFAGTPGETGFRPGPASPAALGRARPPPVSRRRQRSQAPGGRALLLLARQHRRGGASGRLPRRQPRGDAEDAAGRGQRGLVPGGRRAGRARPLIYRPPDHDGRPAGRIASQMSNLPSPTRGKVARREAAGRMGGPPSRIIPAALPLP